MTVSHYIAAWKLSALVGTVLAGIVIALHPTVQVALIVGATAVGTALISGGISVLLRKMDRKDREKDREQEREDRKRLQSTMTEMKISVDGNLSKILSDKFEMGVRLADKSDKLAHAEGVQQERVEARDRASERDKNTP